MAKPQKDIRFLVVSRDTIIMKDGDEITPIRIEEENPKQFILRDGKTIKVYLDKDGLRFVGKTAAAMEMLEASSENKISPPSSAFLSALLPLSKSEDVIENLNELFCREWLARHGSRKARWIWRMQAIQIILKHWLGPVAALLDRIERLRIGH